MTRAIGIGTVSAALALTVWMGTRTPAPDAAAPVPSPVAPATTLPAPPAKQPLSVPTPVSTPVLTEDEQGRVTRALASGRLEFPADMAVLRGHTGTLPGPRDATPAFAPTAPAGTAVIEPRPHFSWTAMGGATRYSVRVLDERFREVARSGSLKDTKWTPSRNLPRGRVLAWQITAVTPEGTVTSPAPPQPEARFIVLDATTVASLARTRTRLSTEPIALGLALAKAGLFADADFVLQTALTDERYDRAQVSALLARLRAR